jgi:tetratricopeptide (TPR) repeat protein
MVDGDDVLLTPLEAALQLGITAELLFQFTKHNFAKASGLRALCAVEREGKTHFNAYELDEFDKLLSGYWCGPTEARPNIPKAILDHLRAESQNQCARCGSGIGVDTAHIVPWAVGRSHHPHNLIRICASCHREHDAQQSLSTEELQKIKQTLIDRTRARLKNRDQPPASRFRPPRHSKQFFGRESELKTLTNALQLGESVIISGVGGIGKSELLLQALSRIELGRTVLWCNIEQYRSVTDFVMALRTALTDDDIACSEAELPSRLDNVQACVVFDGIEQSSLNNLDEFEDAITRLLHETYFTQFVLTSQVMLYRFPADARLQLKGLNESASRLLFHESYAGHSADTNDHSDLELLRFCDGHALAIRFAGALTEYYGGAVSAMAAIKRNGTQSFRLPGRKTHSRQTSLDLCLQTAYTTLSEDSRKLLLALALAPAGFFTQYIEGNCIDIEDTSEALASLRRWHFVDVILINDKLSRSRLLAPIRQFVIDRARTDELELYEHVIRCTVRDIGMMVAVLELNYGTPEDTPHVMQRYEVELPNFLNVLELARTREKDRELIKTAISIARSLIRYFFVSRIPEQGTQVMLEATELALRSVNLVDASKLAMSFMSLASRSFDDSLITKGLNLVDRIENIIDSAEGLPDLAISRAIAAQNFGDFSSAEQHARKAFEGYRARLRSVKENSQPDGNQGLHNDISCALGILGYSLLSQSRYKEAIKAYRHSLNHERGASIGVNRGQTLHQIGNCEAYQGNYKAAAELYFEAAKIFHFVRMEEYLSNASGELGYTLLDIDWPEILDQLSEELVDCVLVDLSNDTKRVFNPTRPLDHQQCIRIIRKLFGTMILVSLAEYGGKLKEFCVNLANETIVALGEQVNNGARDKDEVFPIVTVDLILHIGLLIAQGEIDLKEEGDITNETTKKLLQIVCGAHDWAYDVMRLARIFHQPHETAPQRHQTTRND